MSPVRRVLTWIRTADAPVPKAVRAARREAARLEARRRHGSITAHMEFVVDTANEATTGSAFPARHRPRRVPPGGGVG